MAGSLKVSKDDCEAILSEKFSDGKFSSMELDFKTIEVGQLNNYGDPKLVSIPLKNGVSTLSLSTSLNVVCITFEDTDLFYDSLKEQDVSLEEFEENVQLFKYALLICFTGTNSRILFTEGTFANPLEDNTITLCFEHLFITI